MGRNKNKTEAPPPVSESSREIMAQLAAMLKASGVSQAFYSIRRRRVGENVYPWFRRNVPFDAVPNVVDYCYAEGGKDAEYRVDVHDATGTPIPVEGGKPCPPIFVPALLEDTGAAQLGPDIAEERKRLAEQRESNRLMRERLDLDRESARLAAQQQAMYGDPGAGEPPPPPDEDDSTMGGFWEKSWGPPPWIMKMMNPPAPPALSLDKVLAAIAGIVGALAPLLTQKREDASEVILKLLPILKGDGKDPTKAVFDLLGPFITQIGSIQSEAAKTALHSIAEADASFREKMIDFLVAKGEPDDVVSKWERVLGVAERSIDRIGGSILMRTLGRGSIVDPKKRVDTVAMPKLTGAKQAALAPGANPGLAAPLPPAPASAGPIVPAPVNGAQHVAPPAPSPEVQARAARKAEMVKQRVAVILAALSEELEVESDPASIAEILRQNQYGLLPRNLRTRLEALAVNDLLPSAVAEVYETLRLVAPEAVDEQLADVANDPTGERKAWLAEFWACLLEPEDNGPGPDEDEDDEDDEGEDDDGPPEPGDGELVETKAEAKS